MNGCGGADTCLVIRFDALSGQEGKRVRGLLLFLGARYLVKTDMDFCTVDLCSEDGGVVMDKFDGEKEDLGTRIPRLLNKSTRKKKQTVYEGANADS